MSFTDEAIILDARAHGETHAIVNLFTREHGRCAGLVHGGQGRRMRPLLQPGNEVAAEWRGRDGSLGHFSLELTRARAAEALNDRLSLGGLGAACAVALAVLPEREAHPRSYAGLTVLLDHLSDADIWPALMARWELGMLADLGFGLTLDRCASTGSREDLIYVSPRSACAVSKEAGAPYKDKMLPLPGFLKNAGASAQGADALDGLATTGYFLETRILHITDKPLPEARRRVLQMLLETEGLRTGDANSL
ncbi:MAG: DNA repair protein RecO [Pseudomonadota bacterium]